MIKKPKIVKKPIRSVSKSLVNKELETNLKNRSIKRKDGKYKRNRTKEIEQKLKELNKERDASNFFYFDGKKITSLNLNVMELHNIHKLLSPKDKKIINGITADISLRINRYILKKKIKFVDNFGNKAKMNPSYLLSLPLNQLQKIVTPYEYKRLFEIVKRMPEKNLNFILKNFSNVQKMQEKNKILFVSNLLVKAGVAEINGLFKKNIKKIKEKVTKSRKKLNFEEKIEIKFKLYSKYYKNKISIEELKDKYRRYGEKYFSRIEKLLKDFTKNYTDKINTNIVAGIERIIEDSFEQNHSTIKIKKRYKKLISENINV